MGEGIRPATILEILLWALGKRTRMIIRGDSMLPLLKPGDDILINPNAYRRRLPQPGDIVAARHPFQAGLNIVKQVESVDSEGNVILVGLNPLDSTDSRSFGRINSNQILGQATCKLGYNK